MVDGKQRLTSLLGFFLNGEDNMPLEVDTRFREKMDNDVLQAKVFELERCLANDVLQAKVFELEGQVEEMNALYNLKLRQENSRPSTPAFAPKDSESMLHQQAHASSRELQASRQSEIGLEKQVYELNQELAALRIQLLVLDELREGGREEEENAPKGVDGTTRDGSWREQPRMRQESIRDEMAAASENSAALKQLIQGTTTASEQEREGRE